ncbi:hypothetical protein [Streptomyces kaniharaensis]|uniref:hypothetical protein n=1 Tax=Streptomyces kaniharaensis TaxID=212423 RepID=UPI0018A830DE|nr:hypothetical protein [Streptomyces kaniharaensis]
MRLRLRAGDGGALLIHPKGGPDGRAVAFARGLARDERHILVVVDLPAGAAEREWTAVARLLAPARYGSLRLVFGRGDRTEVGQAAARIAERLDREVIAPDGEVTPTVTGGLFVPAHHGDGWLRYRPGRAAERDGQRFPKPSWEFSTPVRPWPAGPHAVAEPLPAGVWLRSTREEPADAERRHLVEAVPADPELLLVVLGSPGAPAVTLDEVANFWGAVLPSARPAVRFVLHGTLDTPATADPGQALADALGHPVVRYAALPAAVGDAGGVLVAAGPAPTGPGRPAELVHLPGGGTRSAPPVPAPGGAAGSPGADPGRPSGGAIEAVGAAGCEARAAVPRTADAHQTVVRAPAAPAPVAPGTTRLPAIPAPAGAAPVRAGATVPGPNGSQAPHPQVPLPGAAGPETARQSASLPEPGSPESLRGGGTATEPARHEAARRSPGAPAQAGPEPRGEDAAAGGPGGSDGVGPDAAVAEPAVTLPAPDPSNPDPNPNRNPAPAPAPRFRLESGGPVPAPAAARPVPDPAPEPSRHPVPAPPEPTPPPTPAPARVRIQPTPTVAACAVPSERGIDQERDWVRRTFSEQFNAMAGSVSRVMSESPGLRGEGRAGGSAALTELVAVRLYLSGDGRRADAAVRSAVPGPHVPMARCVAAGLGRLPSYRGPALLRTRLDASERALYREGELLTEWAFCHARTTLHPGPSDGTDVLVWSMTARRTALLDPSVPDRVLFLPGTGFKVLRVDGRTVLLRELSPSEITADGRVQLRPAKLDALALAGLERILPALAGAGTDDDAEGADPPGLVPTTPSEGARP